MGAGLMEERIIIKVGETGRYSVPVLVAVALLISRSATSSRFSGGRRLPAARARSTRAVLSLLAVPGLRP
jgi:hypothetical protein